MTEGFFPVSRKFFEHDFWTKKRVFSQAEAWLDLLQSARYELIPKKQLVGNAFIEVKRGEIIAAVRYLIKRWNWSSHKVTNFLNLLESEQMILIKREQGINHITICKYDSYNPFQNRKGTQKEHKGNAEGTEGEQKGNKTNKDNKEIKKEENIYEGLSDEDLITWANFDKWFKAQEFKNVTLIQDQLSPKQLIKLKNKFGSERIVDGIQSVENYQGASKKYSSVYLTLNNWLKS